MRREYLSLLSPLVLVLIAPAVVRGQDHTEAALASIDANADRYAQVAQEIWDLAEVGYQEVRSCALLQEPLRAAGFTIETGIAEIPTAFIATYGQGAPVIALLAEYDALPGITQDAVPERKVLPRRPRAMPAGTTCSARDRQQPPSLSRTGWCARILEGPSASMARRLKKVAQGRSIWCAPACSTMLMRFSIGI